ncbi:hypothetical protein VSDG_04954 [Cytospora chrysosperma]|uniref:Uncharacterized protein n=1 Tax=Cytospora chrysosperma TaxID=252740 RepID=A0A423W3L7_CYTCH|nr:hypothetical protein VSDG_04954 [Valsa sordida]
MCDSFRTVVGRIQYLRLRLTKVCSAVFGEHDKMGSRPVGAPKLKDCIINLTQRTPGTSPGFVDDFMRLPIPLPSLIPKLQSSAQVTSTFHRLWVIDCQASGQGKNSWAAWVRRDIGSDASWPISLVIIGGLLRGAWLARLPKFDSGPSIDRISSPETLEAAVEGFAWSGAQTGIRLPTTILVARGYERALDPLRTRVQLREVDELSCTLWENEVVTGEALLPSGPGALMQTWDLNERTPSRWTRANFAGSSMIRLNG